MSLGNKPTLGQNQNEFNLNIAQNNPFNFKRFNRKFSFAHKWSLYFVLTNHKIIFPDCISSEVFRQTSVLVSEHVILDKSSLKTPDSFWGGTVLKSVPFGHSHLEQVKSRILEGAWPYWQVIKEQPEMTADSLAERQVRGTINIPNNYKK